MIAPLEKVAHINFLYDPLTAEIMDVIREDYELMAELFGGYEAEYRASGSVRCSVGSGACVRGGWVSSVA
ncbi:hypothetical protein [Arthrobacter sp. AET 35A]|uniref:hypothetical protein n=1 Tax=Arthrobacter sp. AET 35A TaxID=2292643 RepID=UPI0017843EC1|nr:hypothetical protein [Arthrobacter sp. AET 35A]MBE0010973.1 hypothetical protein [Arthrobacter sp. AET 35A]